MHIDRRRYPVPFLVGAGQRVSDDVIGQRHITGEHDGKPVKRQPVTGHVLGEVHSRPSQEQSSHPWMPSIAEMLQGLFALRDGATDLNLRCVARPKHDVLRTGAAVCRVHGVRA